MSLSFMRKAKQNASALITTLVICSILSMFVMYYLSLIDQQSYLSARSQVWNMAIAVTEAGIEDGLQQLNTAFPDMNTDGWAYDGSTCYYRSNTLADGNSYMSYIYITNWLHPVVMARASVVSLPKYGMADPAYFATAGLTVGQPTTVSRAVLVTTKRNSPFQVAMVAKKNIDLNGQNIYTDSYDSSDPTKSTNGMWSSTLTYKGSRGDVATDMGVIDSISGGNANIYGHAHTGPGSPTTAVQIGSGGSIGPNGGSVNGTITTGWWLPDSNFTFPDTYYPNTAGYLTPSNGTIVTWSNLLSTGSTVTYLYPNFPPAGGASTNFQQFVQSVISPVPVPPDLTSSTANSSSYPNPAPAVVTTNTSLVSENSQYPAPGTYLGIITTNYYNNGKYGTWYTYYQITSYSYTQYTYPTEYDFTPYLTNVVYYTNSYDHILWGTASISTTNYYVASSLSGSTIVLGENAVLALPNGLSMGGNDSILLSSGQNLLGGTVAPANIIVYAGGTSCSINGNGVVNQPGYPIDFLVYCAPTVTSFSFSGNGSFSGVLVAPSADITMNGGGSGKNTDFCGCIIGNSVTMNGTFGFHYDEALAGNNKDGRFLITSWNEVK